MAARGLAFYTLCILLCSLHGVVTATTSHRKKSLHLTYFAREIHSGPNSTLLPAAGTGQGNMSAIGWGTFLVFDNPMKSGKASDSLLLGSVTGSLALIDHQRDIPSDDCAAYLSARLRYNGSSLTVIGNILTPTPPYDCIVAGGTGLLRGYSGYGILLCWKRRRSLCTCTSGTSTLRTRSSSTGKSTLQYLELKR